MDVSARKLHSGQILTAGFYCKQLPSSATELQYNNSFTVGYLQKGIAVLGVMCGAISGFTVKELLYIS